jgi:hypothetical protein
MRVASFKAGFAPGFFNKERVEYMPYKDKNKQAEYQRDWQRMKKAGIDKTPGRTLNPADIKTAQGLLDTLADTISEVAAAETCPLTRARCLGYLISIGLKAVETADLEARLQRLEGDLIGFKKAN